LYKYLATIFFLRLPSDSDTAAVDETFWDCYNKHIWL